MSNVAAENVPLVEARGVAKTYMIRHTAVPVLSDASLALHAGESLAVVGASGAGKSTLLHILGGLDAPDAGDVRLSGTSLYAISSGRRTRLRATKLGFVFQSYHLLPEMDVFENVLLPARAVSQPAGGGAARRRALELLEAVGLADRRKHRPMELSGGEQQRVALARALMNRPTLVLADEPTGNLDEETGGYVLDCLFDLSREAGHGLIIVTHSSETAKRCHRILSLKNGRLEG